MSFISDETKRRMEVSAGMFEDRLRHFVREWASDNDRDRYEMSMQLTRLFVDAMRHQTTTMGSGVEQYAAMQFQERSLQPLRVIMEPSDSRQRADALVNALAQAEEAAKPKC